jgi:hypothetical protein
MAVTSAARSILDAAEAAVAPEQIKMTLTQALERGMATPQQLRKGASERGRRVATLAEGVLGKIEKGRRDGGP